MADIAMAFYFIKREDAFMGRIKSAPSKIRKQADNDRKEYICSCCGKAYSDLKKNFPASQSSLYAGNNYHLTVCRSCVDKLFNHYTETLGSEEEAIKRICMKFDIYFNESLLEASRKISLDRSRIMTYISRANLIQYKGKTFDNSLDESSPETIDDPEDLNSVEIVTQKDITKWGYGFEPQDYHWLNDNYDKLKATNVIDTTTRDELVRVYCKDNLLANKSIKENKVDQYIKFSEAAQKALDRANLTPKAEDASDKAGEKPIGVMIQMFEKEEPIPDPLPEWKDVDGIVHLITVYFFGHLCKMLDIKNKWSKVYEEEMDRYRASVPELEDTEDDEIFEGLINGDLKFLENSPEERGDLNAI